VRINVSECAGNVVDVQALVGREPSAARGCAWGGSLRSIDVQALPITQAVSIGERMPASRNQCAALVMAVFTTLRRDPNSFSP
jgi:hypothetical protein